MFCGSCGTENTAEAKFCKNCGRPLSNGKKGEDVTKTAGKGRKGSSKGILLGLIAVVVLFTTFASFAMFMLFTSEPDNIEREKLELIQYVTFNAEGFDGNVTVTLGIDWDRIVNEYQDKLQFTREAQRASDNISDMKPVDALRSMISLELNTLEGQENGRYSNGNPVWGTWKIDERVDSYFNMEVILEEVRFEVMGRPELQYFSPIDGITISFEGVDTQGVVKITCSDDRLSPDDFCCEPSEGLSNGDIVRIYIPEEKALQIIEKTGYQPIGTLIEKPVMGLIDPSVEAAMIKEMTDDVENELIRLTRGRLNKYLYKTCGVSVYEPVYAGYLLNTLSDNSEDAQIYGKKNIIYIVYAVQFMPLHDEPTPTIYVPYKFENVSVTSDGIKYSYGPQLDGGPSSPDLRGVIAFRSIEEMYTGIKSKLKYNYNYDASDNFRDYCNN